MHIRTRNNLIKFLEENTSGRYLRALQNHNENLGAFEQVLSSIDPGWIVRVTSKRGDIYYLAITLWVKSKIFPGYRICILKKIPWKRWVGDKSENSLYRGDFPEKYKELRNAKT